MLHSTGVAALAERAAGQLGLPADEIRTLRLAALLHDIGRVSVPNSIWAHPGPLDWSAWERVRLNPYYTGRILGPVPALAPVAEIATAAHERLDGSGYPQHRTAQSLSLPARVLAAADMAFAMSEDRPHRAASALGGDRARADRGGDGRAGSTAGPSTLCWLRWGCPTARRSLLRRTGSPTGSSRCRNC